MSRHYYHRNGGTDWGKVAIVVLIIFILYVAFQFANIIAQKPVIGYVLLAVGLLVVVSILISTIRSVKKEKNKLEARKKDYEDTAYFKETGEPFSEYLF